MPCGKTTRFRGMLSVAENWTPWIRHCAICVPSEDTQCKGELVISLTTMGVHCHEELDDLQRLAGSVAESVVPERPAIMDVVSRLGLILSRLVSGAVDLISSLAKELASPRRRWSWKAKRGSTTALLNHSKVR